MSTHDKNLLECCLFFTANSLARAITRMGEEEFARIGMAPSYAFLLSLAIERPGISQKELAASLHITPSTVSRFVDTLVKRGLIEKEVEGRNTLITATDKGVDLKPQIEKSWHNLYQRYSRILGQDQGEMLTQLTADACRKLENE